MLSGLATFQNLVTSIVWIAFLVLDAWAFVDCARRNPQLFPAIERQTKTLWLILTGLGTLATFAFGPLNFFGIAAIVIALVYLFDLRPRFAEISQRRW
jgi:Protein of unknown function (DUF2516)